MIVSYNKACYVIELIDIELIYVVVKSGEIFP